MLREGVYNVDSPICSILAWCQNKYLPCLSRYLKGVYTRIAKRPVQNDSSGFRNGKRVVADLIDSNSGENGTREDRQPTINTSHGLNGNSLKTRRAGAGAFPCAFSFTKSTDMVFFSLRDAVGVYSGTPVVGGRASGKNSPAERSGGWQQIRWSRDGAHGTTVGRHSNRPVDGRETIRNDGRDGTDERVPVRQPNRTQRRATLHAGRRTRGNDRPKTSAKRADSARHAAVSKAQGRARIIRGLPVDAIDRGQRREREQKKKNRTKTPI